MKKIAVIGAGASGLFLAKKLAGRSDVQLYVFERSKNVGTKLRASGGGKANIFNIDVTPLCYNNPDFIAQLLLSVTPERLQTEFEQMGLPVIIDEEGRAYPMTQFSQTVVDVLYDTDAPNLHFELEYEVKQLSFKEDKWIVDNYPVIFDQVVIATGSPANMIPQNCAGYNAFLSGLKLKTNELHPSLVGFKIKNYPKKLSGCRVKVIASLCQNNSIIHKEAGEVTFKDDGLSGIVILNMSAYYNRLQDKKNCYLLLNFLYQNPDYDVQQHWEHFHSFKGLLHPKLNELYSRNPFDLKQFRLDIEDTYALPYSQVCHGGVDLSEVDENFALRRFPNMYMTGELLDVDGICGGYNLFFAFASALKVAEVIG